MPHNHVYTRKLISKSNSSLFVIPSDGVAKIMVTLLKVTLKGHGVGTNAPIALQATPLWQISLTDFQPLLIMVGLKVA